jgi:hypothetical protein
MNQLLQKHELNTKIIAYVKDEGSNLSPTTIATQV